jgi:hypothetical protein
MKNIAIIYLEDYGLAEQDILREQGIHALRFENGEALPVNAWPELKFLLRAKKLKSEDYKEYYSQLSLAGYELINNPDIFILHGSFELYYPLVKDFSPRSIIIAKDMDSSSAIETILDSQIPSPVFVRSEIESAAKYVGVAGCMMQEISKDQFETCRANLDEHIKNYEVLILKEVVGIKKHDGHNLEYRAIVINDVVITFDYDTAKIPDPELTGLDVSIRKIVNEIYNNGFTGAYFMDFAVTTENTLIIIESKDIVNGTIKDIAGFGASLT